MKTLSVGLLLLALALAACGGDSGTATPSGADPALAFALAYEPVSTDEDPVPGLPVPDTETAAAFERRPVTAAARRAVAIVGTRLWRHHAEHFAQAYELRTDESSYELRKDEPNPILDAFAALLGRDFEGLEFLPSSAIHVWATAQEDLAADPLIGHETKWIEKALARAR